MSYSGQSGAIYFGPQSAKSVIATTFYRYPATDIDFDAISPGGVLPPEIAGILTPRGAYKMGVFAAGGFSFIPRLDGDLGWLLLGLFGEVDTEIAEISAYLGWTAITATMDSDDAWFDSDGFITQPATPRRLYAAGGLYDAAQSITILVTGDDPSGLPITESMTFSGSGDSAATNQAFSFIDNIEITSVAVAGVFAVGFAPSWYAQGQYVMPFTEGDGTPIAITTGLTSPKNGIARKLRVSLSGPSADSDLIINVAGTDANDLSINENFEFAAGYTVAGTQYFKSVTAVTLDSDLDSDQHIGVGFNGVNIAKAHFFTYAADQEVIDWMTIRKVIPGDTDYFCEVLDCKLAMARFIVPQAGPVAARIDAVGRVPSFPEDVQATWDSEADADDDPDAFPIANATGFFKITDKEGNIDSLGVTGMIFEIVNLLTTPQEEMTVGSNYPDDFGVRGRAVTCRFVYRWKDPELCRQIMTGASSGSTAWTAEVFTTDVEAEVTAPGVMQSLVGEGDDFIDTPYKLRFSAPKVEFRQNGPLRLVGNQTIAVEFIGSVLTPESSGLSAEGGDEYFTVELWNQVTGYTWP